MNFEICTDSVEGAMAADKQGAQRIELCAALSAGGLTPSFGLIQQCVEKSSIEVHAMIRHKEGDFNYSEEDVLIMKNDISIAKKAGAAGVVFGILNTANEISDLNLELVQVAKSLKLEVTFHRAFDFVPDYQSALEKIISFKFDRLLTSGLQATAIEGLDLIKTMQSKYGEAIQIMAGSGINPDNAVKIATSGINNIHFTARKPGPVAVGLSMGNSMIPDHDKIKTILSQFNR